MSNVAINALRQLASKFLEKDELANYQFQKHFLTPFETIFTHPRTPLQTRLLVIECLSRLVTAQIHNVKSGWKTVFSV